MKILGVDPGLKATGYGLLKCHKDQVRIIEAGTIEPKVKDLFHNRLDKVYKLLAEVIKEHKPDVMVLEKLYTHTQHLTTASILGHVRGCICLLCAHHNIEFVEYSPKRIRKAITGNGNASKIQVRRVVAKEFKIKEESLSLDASDAIALALGYAQLAGRNL